MEKFKIDVVLILSVWRETYCYTADEAMMMGLPVICFDVGAHAERVRNYPKGTVVKDEQELFQTLKAYLSCQCRHQH